MKKTALLLMSMLFMAIGSVTAQEKKLIKDGEAMPNYTFETVDGKKVAIKDLKGKYIFIDIWATWCTACHGEVPRMLEIEEMTDKKKIVFLSLSIDKKRDLWENWVKDNNLKGLQVVIGDSRNMLEEFGVRGIPRFILIDKDGNVVRAEAPRPLSGQLEPLLKSLSLMKK